MKKSSEIEDVQEKHATDLTPERRGVLACETSAPSLKPLVPKSLNMPYLHIFSASGQFGGLGTYNTWTGNSSMIPSLEMDRTDTKGHASEYSEFVKVDMA
jgi:hypothetical protein